MVIHNKQMLENFKDKKGKINVAVFSDIYKPFVGGVTTVVEDMMENLQQDCNIVLFCQGQRKNKDNDKFPIIRCKTIPFFKSVGDIPVPKLDRKLEKTFKDLEIDVIHIHTFFGLASFALKMGKKYKIPVVYHGHTKLYDEYMSITNNKIVSKILTKRAVKKLNKATEVWTVSEGTKKLYQSFGVSVPIKVVRNTTKFDYLDNKKFVEEIKDKYNLHSKNVVLFMSRISIKTKNIDFLLRSCQKVMQKLNNFQLVIVGGGRLWLDCKISKRFRYI